MKNKDYKILSLEAKDIYQQIALNAEKTIYYSNKDEYDFCINDLDYSLDIIELEKCYDKICRHNINYKDKEENEFNLAIINVSFNESHKNMSLKQLRQFLYNEGFSFCVGRYNIHYVRYKRSAGSAREGNCLFIDEKLLKHMNKWGECGLKSNNGSLASWEAYKSLSLSSLVGTINIPLNGILFVNDYESEFLDNAICVEKSSDKLSACLKKTNIKNVIWDGESLLDESFFVNGFSEKHMLLLRNKFFKSCAFKTKLKQWIKDKNITLDDLKSRGFITLATDINQIVMVTTPSSMKFLKFLDNKLSIKNILIWAKHIDDSFGIVKYDKRTKFFDGKMVQTSYQFINTLGLSESQVVTLLENEKKYIKTVRDDVAFMKYHFEKAFHGEKEKEEEEQNFGIAERSEVIFSLMKINSNFAKTSLYYNFRNDVVETIKDRLKQGHILLPGTNATLFGNGPELLLALSGSFDLNSKSNHSMILNSGEIYSNRFNNGENLVCARSPHITMGNIYCVQNNTSNEIWKYFDLGNNIVCVNAIDENIQQRLNGCDYDSDSVLITNDELIVNVAFSQKNNFLVPVYQSSNNKKYDNQKLWELDYFTSTNKIGEIVNLSQKLNCLYWDTHYFSQLEKLNNIYLDVCKLSVLSGLEIDKAKRPCDVDTFSVIKEIKLKYKGKDNPMFFKEQKEVTGDSKFYFYNSSMEYVYKYLSSSVFDFRKNKVYKQEYFPISYMIKLPKEKKSTNYDHKNKAIQLMEDYHKKLQEERSKIYNSKNKYHPINEDKKKYIYSEIKKIKEDYQKRINKYLDEEQVISLVIKEYENTNKDGWELYSLMLINDIFIGMLNKSKEKMDFVVEDPNGNFDLFGLKFTKKKEK